MNRDIRNVTVAVALVLVVFIIAGALFLYGDSYIALLSAITGVPAAIIIASVVCIRSMKQWRLEDPARRVKIRGLRSVGRDFLRLRNQIHAIDDTYTVTIPSSIKEMDAIESAIQNSGGSIDPDTQSIDCKLARSIHEARISGGDACSMCGNCARSGDERYDKEEDLVK